MVSNNNNNPLAPDELNYKGWWNVGAIENSG